MPAYTLEELKEMFISQAIFRESIEAVNNKIDAGNKTITDHMDEKIKGLEDSIKPVCTAITDHETRLTTAEKELKVLKDSGQSVDGLPKSIWNSIWFKLGLGLIVALVGALGGVGVNQVIP